ncbi:hypothetical protein ACWDZ4_04765 [Streptomyces sp. NPDC003016]
MNSAHRADHQLIAEAIEEDWLDRDRLLVHLAREHGFKVGDVANYGMVPLTEMHNGAHIAEDAIPYVPPLQRISDALAARIDGGEIAPGSTLTVEVVSETYEIDRRRAKHVLGNLRADGFLRSDSDVVELPSASH